MNQSLLRYNRSFPVEKTNGKVRNCAHCEHMLERDDVNYACSKHCAVLELDASKHRCHLFEKAKRKKRAPKWVPADGKPTQKILDACCGSRMFWKQRDRQDVLFMDIRKEEHTLCDGRKLVIDPDIVADFRNMPFPDKSSRLVVFDPPHLINLGENALMAKKYGRLNADTWQDDLRRGFDECLRVLDDDGVLILKWNTRDIQASVLFKVLGQEPLFGSLSGKSGKTLWCVYVKGME